MKTKNRAHDAATYTFTEGERILVDANVWLYLCPPAGQLARRWAVGYSNAFAKLLRAKSVPLVDALVLSEFLNRYVRIEYEASWKSAYPSYKDFRQSSDSAQILHSVAAEIGLILRAATPCDTLFAGADLVSVLTAVESGVIDFNDGLLVENCRINGWKLLTNDSDMTVGGIEVLTTHKGLLSSCP